MDSKERLRRAVKGKVPQAGPTRKKHRAKDPFFSNNEEIYQACQTHEDFKPLRRQLLEDYMKAIYDPDPDDPRT